MIIRRIEPGDLDEFVELCAAHAAFEKCTQRPDVRRLRAALFESPIRLHAWVAIDNNRLLGFASATVDFATWSASEFVHLDCLFVREEHRGEGIGPALLNAVSDYARSRGITEMQWQTPDWNADAQRFYERMNAKPSNKVRYTLSL